MKHYLNHFTATMKQLAQQFIDGPWKGHWPAFICLLGGKPTAPDWVTWTWFVSMDQMAQYAYQWYHAESPSVWMRGMY
jgi:hypothetical protein